MDHKSTQIQATSVISTEFIYETPNYKDLSTLIHIYGNYPVQKTTDSSNLENNENREIVYSNLSHLKIIKVSCSKNHVLFLSEIGKIFSFGQGYCGQLGHGSNVIYLNEPTCIPDFDKNIINISCGRDHSVGIDNEGYVYTWGSEAVSGHKMRVYSPTQLDILDVSGDDILMRFSASNDNQIATVTLDMHSIYIWGESFTGRRILKPTLFYDDCETSFVQIDLGLKFGIARSSAGGIFLWGDGKYGELATEEYDTYLDLPQRSSIPCLNNIIDIAAGERHALVVDDGGNMYSFGDNLSGQCGDPSKPHTIIYTPQVFMKDSKFKPRKVFCGSRHSACINESNQLFTWGHSSNRKLIFTPPPIQRPGVSIQSGQKSACLAPRLIYSLLHLKVTDISLGPDYTVVITGEGIHPTKDSTAQVNGVEHIVSSSSFFSVSNGASVD